MKINLPIVGEVRTGKDIPEIKVVDSKDKFFDGVLGGLIDISEMRLSSEKSISTALLKANTGWVFLNNDVIAQEISKIEFELYTLGLSNGDIVYNEIENHPLLDLLDKPNPETTKSDAIYIIQSHKKLTGDAFWLKIRNGTQTVGLRTLPPDKITLQLQPPTPEDPTVITGYHYQDVIDGNKIDIVYRPEDIIHFKKPNPSNPFRGYGTVEALAETIDLDNLTTQTTKSFFQKGAIQNFVLSTDSKVTDEQLKRVRAEMRSQYAGAKNAYQTMILGNGLKPVDVSYSNKDQEFLGQLEWYRDKIMAGFGNTKASLGMIDDVNRASHEGSIIEWQRNTVKPDMQAIVNTLNEFLVPEFGQNLVLGFTDPVPEDRTDDVAEAKDLYQAGIIMRSEAREIVDMDSTPEDEVYYQSTLATLNPGNEDQNIEEIDEEDE